MSDIEIAAMEAGSKYSDRWDAQQDDKSYMHSMTSDEISYEEMVQLRDAFVINRVSTGASLLDGSLKGNISGYFTIGEGIHTVMDQYSPAHMGSNQHWSMSDFHKHGPFPTSIEGMRSVTNPAHNHIIGKMRDVWSPN